MTDSTDSATPRPWEFHDMEANTIVTVQKPGQPVALCDAHNLSDDENHANAALIVAAVNSYEELREALEDTAEALELLAGSKSMGVESAPVKADAESMGAVPALQRARALLDRLDTTKEPGPAPDDVEATVEDG